MYRHMKLGASLLLLATTAGAEVVSSSENHFVLRHEAESTLPPHALWDRLIQPSTWWHPDHSYSGKAENLSLDPTAGGLWREDWEGGSVSHGRVLYVQEGKTIRLEAPFGPLQELGVYVIWTINISENEDGSTVVFDEVANGPSTANLPTMAKAVDGVKAEAIRRLTMP
ncbi:MAG: hypothetical protein AAF358_16545 [Pseudomonadota bacterium]